MWGTAICSCHPNRGDQTVWLRAFLKTIQHAKHSSTGASAKAKVRPRGCFSLKPVLSVGLKVALTALSGDRLGSHSEGAKA